MNISSSWCAFLVVFLLLSSLVTFWVYILQTAYISHVILLLMCIELTSRIIIISFDVSSMTITPIYS